MTRERARWTGLIIQAAYALQKSMWRLLRPRTRGVKVMLFNPAGELVLIRNAYGRTDLFVLPGGGVRPFESPQAAAIREIREELGLTVSHLSLRSRHSTTAEGKRDTIFLFESLIEGVPRPDDAEVKEARFADVRDLPVTTSPATRRRIEEYIGKRTADGKW